MRKKRKKKLTAHELKAAGLTPELVMRRIRPKKEFSKFVRNLVDEASNGNENRHTRGR